MMLKMKIWRKRNEVQSVFPPKCFPHTTYQFDIPSFLLHHDYDDLDDYDDDDDDHDYDYYDCDDDFDDYLPP